MAFEVPKDLVEGVQILLRKEAGLEESYNPSDPSISPNNLPSVEEVIASFDPSPDYFRCKHCKGKLLRGLQSLVCVYCGRDQQKEFPPEPISFSSTIGFRWLLDSLGLLDGSEILVPVNEDLQANRGQISVKDEIALSDFLDFKMKWPVGSERFGINDSDEAQIQGKRSLHLVGVDFDDSFSELKTENLSSFPAEHAISTEETSKEDEMFPVEEDPSFLRNYQTSGVSLKLDNAERCDSMFGWEADFQSASSGALPKDLNSSPVSQSNVVDYAAHKDSVFGPAKESQEGKVTDDSVPNDFWSNSLPAASASVQKSAVGTLPEDVGKGSEPFTSSSTTADSSQENQQQSHKMESVDSVNDIEEDSSDTWNDFADTRKNQSHPTAVPKSVESSGNDESSHAGNNFTGSKGAQENQQQESSVKGSDDDFSDAWNDFASSGGLLESKNANAIERKLVGIVEYSLDAWNDFASLTNAEQNQLKTSGEKTVETETVSNGDSVGVWSYFPSLEKQGDQLKDRILQSPVDAVKKHDDIFDLWDNFVGSSVGKDGQRQSNNLKPAVSQPNRESGNTVDVWGDFMSLHYSRNTEQTGKATDDKSIGNDGDPFDPWNEFASSVTTLDNKKSSEDDIKCAGNDTSNSTNQRPSAFAQASENMAVEDDDSFNSWSDFRSSGSAVGTNLSSGTGAPVAVESIADDDFSYGAWSDFWSSTPSQAREQHSIAAKASENKMAVKDDYSFSSWGDFRSSSSVQNNQWQKSEAKAAQEDDLFNGWSSSITASESAIGNGKISQPDLNPSSGNDNSFDAWLDFTSSANVQGNRLQNRKESILGDGEAVKQQNDPFDTWNLLMNSSSSLKNCRNVDSNEHSSDTSLFSSAINLQHSGLCSSSRPDPFINAMSDQSSYANLAAGSSEAPTLFRTSSSGGETKETKKDETSEPASKETTKKKPTDVERLISQMPDLSFMLGNSLSVPKKPE